MIRGVCACVCIGLLSTVTTCGCSDAKKEAKIPEKTIELPKEGPIPAGGAGGRAPSKGPAPAPPNELAD